MKKTAKEKALEIAEEVERTGAPIFTPIVGDKGLEEFFSVSNEMSKLHQESCKEARSVIEGFHKNSTQGGLPYLLYALEDSLKDINNGREAGRRVGKHLDEIGGLELMRLYHAAVYGQHQGELDYWWNNIGDWQA